MALWGQYDCKDRLYGHQDSLNDYQDVQDSCKDGLWILRTVIRMVWMYMRIIINFVRMD